MGEGHAKATAKGPTQGVVFAVDDDPSTLRVVERTLAREGFQCKTSDSAEAVLQALASNSSEVDLVLSDINMENMTGLDLLAAVRETWPDIVMVMLTAEGDIGTAVEAMRRGAYDYLTKPFDPVDTLLPAVRRAIERSRLVSRNQFLQRQLDVQALNTEIVGESHAIRDVLSLVAAAAPTDATVLILGESGTGKELVARAVHGQSKRAGKAFVAINCGALSETVLESELFGHARGAFTGAVSARKGLFEEASGGTLFLDEVGELTLATQVRLLRVLQEGTVRAVGSNESRQVDVRVIAATNRDLAQEVQDGKFRADLFYRLDVVALQVPPLRQRPTDIPLLLHHFIRKHSARFGRAINAVAPEALERLCAHRWPGNVRELENAVERGIALATSDTLNLESLPPALRAPIRAPANHADDERLLMPLAQAKAAFEQEYLEKALERANGKVAEAARFAGLDPSNLRRLLKRST
jgi:two-component system response regulator HydG